MKRILLVITLLTIFSLPVFGQSFIAVGPQVGAATSDGTTGGSQTQAGINVTGQYSFKVASLEFGMGGSMSVTNQARYFDDGDGAVFEAEPVGRMYLPVSDNWSLYFNGGANMQRISSIDTTIVNPVAGFGVRHLARGGNGELNHSIEFGYDCLFDDVNNNGVAAKVMRGGRFKGQLYKKVKPRLGFLFGARVDRQSNAILFLQPRTQATFNFGVAFGPR